MTATARKFNITAKDLANEGGGGAYAELDVPWDGRALCTDVSDYKKKALKPGGKPREGWLAEYEVTTDSGKQLDFSVHLSFSPGARWKIVQWAEAHELNLTEGVQSIDPNEAIDTETGVHIDFGEDDEGEPTKYREIQEFFPLAELDEDDETEAIPEDEDTVEAIAEAEGEEEPDVL